VRSIIVRGSSAIYGAEPNGPEFFTEEMARHFPLRTRFQRDVGELESYFENFARRHPDVTCCLLRYQPEIGPGLDVPLVRYLSLPVVPTQLGFDPRLQLLHADDATGALAAATRNPVRGPVNVAPRGTISLTKILRLAGRPTMPVPHPLFGPMFGQLGRMLGAADLYNDGVMLLRYGRGVDNRRLLDEIGYEPRFDAEGAVRDFVAKNAASRRLFPSPLPGAIAQRMVSR
jgi:UDP-glucose 4-epimerase